jgi:hypothetical protein
VLWVSGIFDLTMGTLIFIIVVLSFIFLVAKIVLHRVAGKDIVVLIRMLMMLALGYVALWGVFFAFRNDRVTPLGVDSCFDDWCAMVTGADYPATLGRPSNPVFPEGQFVVLYVRLSNPAQAAQRKETQPRVFLRDEAGHEYAYSLRGQRALEEGSGPQAAFVNQPGLQQSFETELVFDVPAGAKRLSVRIDNDPGFLYLLLLPEGRQVTALP